MPELEAPEGGGEDRLAFFKKKVGPLPVWGYVAIGGVLLGLVIYMRRRSAGGTAAAVSAPVGTPVGSGATGFTQDQLGQLQGLVNGEVSSAFATAAGAPAAGSSPTTSTGSAGPPTNPLTQFVNQEFTNLLGRSADAGGAAYWSNQLAAGQSTQQQFLAIESTPEAAARAQQDAAGFVQGQYEQVLGRQADASGLAYWTGVLQQNHGNTAAESAQFLQAAQPELKH